MSPEHAANHPELAQAWHTGHTGTLWQFIVSPKKNVKCLTKKKYVFHCPLKAFDIDQNQSQKTPKFKPQKLPPKYNTSETKRPKI